MVENKFTDTRDGQTYKTVEINGVIWMAENLNFKTEDSWWYMDNELNEKRYGRLYTWDAALKACPPGWRLPTDEEWNELIESSGGTDAGYEVLLEEGTSGMNILLGGYRNVDGKFGRIGALGGYWTGEERGSDRALGFNFDGYYNKIDSSDSLKSSAKSCRCVKIN